MMKVLIVESEFLHQDTWVGNAVERLADALSQQNVTVIKSTSFDDGFAILSSNEAIDCLMFSYQMEHPDEHQNVRQLIGKLHERQQNVPVFLLGDREKALAAMDRDLLELVDEFAWILEDTADFIAGRAVAAMTRYRQQLLPPLFSALMKYSDIHEYSPGSAKATVAALVLPKHPPDVSTMTTMEKICSAPIWASNELPSVLCLTILAHLAKAKNMPHAYLVPIALVGSRRYFRL